FCRSVAVLALVLGALVRLPGSALASPAAPPAGSAGDSLSDLRTPAELNDFERHTSHDEMMKYLVQVRSLAPDMRLRVYGTTWEGRDLPYALFSRPAVATPPEAHATGKPVIVL